MTSETDKKDHRTVVSGKDGAPLDMRFLQAIVKTGTPIAGVREVQ